MICPFLAMCVTILHTKTIFSKCANVHPSTEKYSFLCNIVNNSAQHHPCGGGLVAKDPIPGQLCAGEGYGGGPHRRQGEPTSSAN